MADLVAEFPQFRGELAQAFTSPTQRRHRIATCRRFDQRIEVVKKLRFYLNKRIAAAAPASNATFFERCRQVCSASIRMEALRRVGWRIASPEMLLNINLLP